MATALITRSILSPYNPTPPQHIRNKTMDVENRKDVLLKATLDLLKKCDDGPYVRNILEETAIWDDAECDGFCLMEDIENLLEFGI